MIIGKQLLKQGAANEGRHPAHQDRSGHCVPRRAKRSHAAMRPPGAGGSSGRGLSIFCFHIARLAQLLAFKSIHCCVLTITSAQLVMLLQWNYRRRDRAVSGHVTSPRTTARCRSIHPAHSGNNQTPSATHASTVSFGGGGPTRPLI